MKASFYTFGCKVNQYETQVLSQYFASQGFTIVPFEEEADVYVINSCTVTSTGDKKTKQLVRQTKRRSPHAVVALTGCFPQAFPEKAAAILEADVVAGAKDRRGLLIIVLVNASEKISEPFFSIFCFFAISPRF